MTPTLTIALLVFVVAVFWFFRPKKKVKKAVFKDGNLGIRVHISKEDGEIFRGAIICKTAEGLRAWFDTPYRSDHFLEFSCDQWAIISWQPEWFLGIVLTTKSEVLVTTCRKVSYKISEKEGKKTSQCRVDLDPDFDYSKVVERFLKMPEIAQEFMCPKFKFE